MCLQLLKSTSKHTWSLLTRQSQSRTSALADIEQAQLRYLRYRAEKDPARGMFTRFYGTEWTEEYIHGFLFDLERKLAIGHRA